jgi:hypothetical protein
LPLATRLGEIYYGVRRKVYMDYETLELGVAGAVFADELELEEEGETPLVPVSSSYECVEGADSPYIITSSVY